MPTHRSTLSCNITLSRRGSGFAGAPFHLVVHMIGLPRVPWAQRVLLVLRVLPGQTALWDLLVLSVLPVPLALPERTVQLAPPVLPAPLAPRGSLGLTVPRVPPVPPALPVWSPRRRLWRTPPAWRMWSPSLTSCWPTCGQPDCWPPDGMKWGCCFLQQPHEVQPAAG